MKQYLVDSSESLEAQYFYAMFIFLSIFREINLQLFLPFNLNYVVFFNKSSNSKLFQSGCYSLNADGN